MTSGLRSGDLQAHAIVLGKDRTANLTLQHLSAGTAILIGDLRLALGERVRILLHVGADSVGADVEVLTVHEVSDDQYEISVRFLDTTRETQDRIRVMVRSGFEQGWMRTRAAVLVMDEDEPSRAAAARDIHALGRVAVFATTALEVMRCLNDRSVDIEAAVIDAGLEHVNTTGMLAHLADEHPGIRRVLVASDPRAALDEDVSSGRAHVFLGKPWRHRDFMVALGLSEPPS